MALNFEDCRRKWLQWEEELGACKEVLTKTETERGALEIKLKHARNQVDVEIRRRQRAEAEYEKLVGKQFIRLLQYMSQVILRQNCTCGGGFYCVMLLICDVYCQKEDKV